jgi:hypothetical protein
VSESGHASQIHAVCLCHIQYYGTTSIYSLWYERTIATRVYILPSIRAKIGTNLREYIKPARDSARVRGYERYKYYNVVL